MMFKCDLKTTSRRQFLKAAGFAAVSLMVSSCKESLLQTSAKAKERPNIIFFITDDQHLSDFNFMPEGIDEQGKSRNLTPNLDRLAGEGVVFENGYCSTTVCVPTRFNCFTGMYASRATNERFLSTGKKGGRWESGQTYVEWNTFVTPDTQNTARILKDAGYATGAVGKNHVIDYDFGHWVPDELGGADCDLNDPRVKMRFKEHELTASNAYKSCGFDYVASIYENISVRSSGKQLAYHNTDWIIKGALDYIKEPKDKPFYLYCATTLMHFPFGERMWPANPLATPGGLLEQELDVMPGRDTIAKRLKQAGLKTDFRSCAITWLDDALGAMLAELEEKKIDDNTIIIFLTDQGVDDGGKGALYQGGVRCPIVMWAPAIFKGGKRIKHMVQTIDILPTILELCSVKPADEIILDGESTVPMLKGASKPIHPSLFFEIGNSKAVIKGDYKYIAIRHPDEIENMSRQDRQKELDRWTSFVKETHSGLETEVWWNKDPMAPFDHMALQPGGMWTTGKCVKAHPHYYDPDQLYDLKTDPYEKVNLANDPTYKSKLEEMKTEMKKYLNDLPGPFGELKTV